MNKEKQLFLWLFILYLIKVFIILSSSWIGPSVSKLIQAFIVMSFFLILMIVTLKCTMKDKTINITTLFGALSGFIFLGMIFAYFYAAMFILNPKAFIDFVPFVEPRLLAYSFGSLTSAGAGLLSIQDLVMQTITWIETVCGDAYRAIFISFLVGRYIGSHQKLFHLDD